MHAGGGTGGRERAARMAAAVGAALAAGALLWTAQVIAAGAEAPGTLSPARLGRSALASSAALACLGLAGGLARRPRLGRALGLGPAAAGWPTLVLLAAGTVGLSHVLDQLLQASGLRQDSILETLEGVLAGARGAGLLVALVGVGLAPGVGEELLFRGWLLRALRVRLGAAAAVAISSLCFGALHLDPAQSLAAGVLGLWLGAVAVATGSTRASILCHVANNVVAVLGASLPDPGVLGLAAAVAALAAGLVAGARSVVAGRHIVGELVPGVEGDPEQHAPEEQ